MPRRRWLSLALTAIWPIFAHGQAPTGSPVLIGVSPPGATVGETVEWSISGRNLGKATSLFVAGGGVEVVEFKVDGDSGKAKVRVAKDAGPGFREVRIDGPNGLSNLAIVRVDTLPQSMEVEPNDDPSKAQEVAEGSVVVGTLKPTDLDHFKLKGTAGRQLTLDLEARRIGSAIEPVVTIFGPSGVAMAQGRESRAKDRDCRMTLIMPAEGWCVVQVRDNTYNGGDRTHYRLRVDPSPFATGVFPIGGPKGKPVEVEVSGGNLAKPIRKVLTMPETAGSLVDVGLVESPLGPILAPGRVVASFGPSLVEPLDHPKGSPIDVTQGVMVDGRIAWPEEVDVYRLPIKAGERVKVRVDASAMGSWLDSVVMIRDAAGATLAENDDTTDAIAPNQARAVNRVGVSQGSPDSSVEYEAKADGVLSIEISDRYGEGGPEYAYRLSIGPPRPDFSITLLLGTSSAAAAMVGTAPTRTAPGQFGVFNLKPGATVPVNFLLSPEGRPGPVEVRVEGLPEGVTSDPVSIRMPGPLKPGEVATSMNNPQPVADLLLIRVSPEAETGLSEIKIVATARPEPGVTIAREGMVGVDISVDAARPINRIVTRIPLRIVGESRARFVGPPAPPSLRKVTVPGPLLMGEQIDLALEFGQAISADDGSTLEAKAEGVGLAANTVISAGTTASEDDSTPEAIVHLLASAKAQPGPHKVIITYTPSGGTPRVREAIVEVKTPVEVDVAAASIFLDPGDSATFRVNIKREPGVDGDIELKLEGLPRGVKGPKAVAIPAGQSSNEVKLEMASTAKPLTKGSEIRVVAVARMSRGNVAVEARVRPMIGPKPADK